MSLAVHCVKIGVFIAYHMLPWTTKSVLSIKIALNKLSIDVWFVRIGKYLTEIQQFDKLESEG